MIILCAISDCDNRTAILHLNKYKWKQKQGNCCSRWESSFYSELLKGLNFSITSWFRHCLRSVLLSLESHCPGKDFSGISGLVLIIKTNTHTHTHTQQSNCVQCIIVYLFRFTRNSWTVGKHFSVVGHSQQF